MCEGLQRPSSPAPFHRHKLFGANKHRNGCDDLAIALAEHAYCNLSPRIWALRSKCFQHIWLMRRPGKRRCSRDYIGEQRGTGPLQAQQDNTAMACKRRPRIAQRTHQDTTCLPELLGPYTSPKKPQNPDSTVLTNGEIRKERKTVCNMILAVCLIII